MDHLHLPVFNRSLTPDIVGNTTTVRHDIIFVSDFLSAAIVNSISDATAITNTVQYQYLAKPTINGPRRKKTCLRGFAKNTGADQPAHPRSLISAFVIRFVESIKCKLATGEISIF